MVLCYLFVVFNFSDISIESKIQAEGKILKQDKLSYLVDFSKDLSKKEGVNSVDYKKVLIPRNECIKL